MKYIYSVLMLIGLFIFNGCASNSALSSGILKSSTIDTKNEEWSKGFMILPLKINRTSSQYDAAKQRILVLLKGEADRDRQEREAIVRSGSSRTAYCKDIARNVGNRYKSQSEFKEVMHTCMQAQYRSDLASLKSSFGKSLKIKKDDVSHYAHYRWNLFTNCGSTSKQTTRDIYYGFVEPKNNSKEAYFLLSYSTYNECEAVYEKLRRKTDRVLRKTKRILDKYQVGYSLTNDKY